MSEDRSLRGRAAIVGIGESTYYKRGKSPDSEFELCLKAVIAAAEDAQIDVRDVDGLVSFGADKNEPPKIAAALGVKDLKVSAMQATGSGGGSSGHIGLAAAAVATGMADNVIAYRAITQPSAARFGLGAYGGASSSSSDVSGHGLGGITAAHGFLTPAQKYALRAQRLLDVVGVDPSTFEAVARAAYHHAATNEHAVMHGRPLSSEAYRGSRWISEPFRLYDCCAESDGAAAVLITHRSRAEALRDDPVYVLAAAGGGPLRSAAQENVPDYVTGGFKTLASRLFEQAGLSPEDIDVLQVYDNFTAGVVMAIIEHGFCTPEEAASVLTFDNLTTPGGSLPLNTSGGNFAEAYVQSMQMHVEAVRQLRGTAINQVPDAKTCLCAGGPMTSVSTSVIYGTKDVL
ncbi:acetyl-CoA acetyltransferase [Rhodococcus sp. MS16]|uniref:thiolase C-terminal domain-containing protein n=1 Tax=Rhodococcus sp. MS16 TaxID=2579941 RepID=UPI001562C81C|nr:acetyl-CoA acetyltransferase [Rhodococcus sp. MS16]NRI70055.1 acetyl-CoA acetyltransferase [Rhodococcus sp. MS16]